MSEMIGFGTRPVQSQYRVLLGEAACRAHGIGVTDQVEIFVKKIVPKNEVEI